MSNKPNQAETKTSETADANEKQGFFKGFNWKHAGVAAIIASAVTAVGMHFLSGDSEEAAE